MVAAIEKLFCKHSVAGSAIGRRKSRMADLTVTVVLLTFATCMVSAKEGLQCSPGVTTPGATFPRGDITLLTGSSLDIVCILDPSHYMASGYNSTHLHFYNGSVIVDSRYVTILNDTALRLHIDDHPASNSWYTCKLAKEMHEDVAVCMNSVTVGTAPEKVDNFTCLSLNWNNLTCTWKPPHNFVITTHKLTYMLAGRASRSQVFHCPTVPKDRQIPNSCFWDETTSPLYRQAQAYLKFNLTSENVFGSTWRTFDINHYGRVKPSKLIELRAVNKTDRGVRLRWDVPRPLENFPVGLVHRIVYRYDIDSNIEWMEANVSSLPTKGASYHYDLPLAYAYIWYDVRISVRSEQAIGEDMWSEFASVLFRTRGRIPDRPPDVETGSFEVSNRLEDRDVYVYWKQIRSYEQNGANFQYNVTADIEGSSVRIPPIDSKQAYAFFKKIPHKKVTFSITSSSDEGESSESSQVVVHEQRDLLPEPSAFTKIAFGNNMFELSWRDPETHVHVEIESYTIFWCDSSRDRPFQCDGNLEWEKVPASINIKNITVAEDKIYQFAISANRGSYSSGMVWASCTVIPNKIIGKMKNVWINRVGSTFIEVGWKLECSDRIGVIKGYRISYCPIVGPHDVSCKEPVQNQTVVRSPQYIHSNVTGLKPYTTYAITIAVITRHGDGLQSDTLTNTTLEGAPTPPRNIKISDLTNTRMLVSWDPPWGMNGVLRYYRVNFLRPDFHAQDVIVDRSDGFTEVLLTNLTSYTNYTITVEACTVSCSRLSEAIMVRTAIGRPGPMSRPSIVVYNNVTKFVQLRWTPPELPGGPVNMYEVRVVETATDNVNVTYSYNTTAMELIVPNAACRSDTAAANFYSVRAINMDGVEDHGAAAFTRSEAVTVNRRPPGDENVVTYASSWSPTADNICFVASTGLSIASWVFICVALALVLGFAAYGFRHLWSHYKKMKNIAVCLPIGLETPLPEKESKLSSNGWTHQPKHGKEHEKSYIAPSADEVSLLPNRNLSHRVSPNKGDPGDFSVNTDGTTLSLTSSGRPSSEGTKESAPADSDLSSANSSLRLRNKSMGGSRPASAASSEPATWNSPYTKRDSGQEPVSAIGPYSAVGAWTPDENLIKSDLSSPFEGAAPKGYVSFGKFPSDGDYPNIDLASLGLNPTRLENTAPERGAGGYVSIPEMSNLTSPKEMPPFRTMAVEPMPDLPSGYVKTAPENALRPFFRDAGASGNPSGYVSIDDPMIAARRLQDQTPVYPETRLDLDPGYVKCDDVRFAPAAPQVNPTISPGYVRHSDLPSKRISVPPLVNEKIVNDGRRSSDYFKSHNYISPKQSDADSEGPRSAESSLSPEAYCRLGLNKSAPQQFDFSRARDDVALEDLSNVDLVDSYLPYNNNLHAGRH